MIDSPELRLECLKLAAGVTGTSAAMMRAADALRDYVLAAPGVKPATEPAAFIEEMAQELREVA